MLDEAIITETPPGYGGYGPIGEHVRIPISGGHARRIPHGAVNVGTGDVQLLLTRDWAQREHQHFLNVIRAPWRGWNVVLFEGRAKQQTCPGSRWVARACAIERRLLPRATPEWNAMDPLWKHTKGTVLADRPAEPIDRSAQAACDDLLGLSPEERLRKAGVLSGDFRRGP
jgi:hypothetical protein